MGEEENQHHEDYTSGEDYRSKMKDMQPAQAEGITWKHKATVGFLAVFAVSAIFLWAIQFKSNLAINKPSPEGRQAGASKTNEPDLRKIDTDQDGLSDYDELYFYNTSPYLEDTDSDGLEDKAEIEIGEDPNCPKGENCFSGSVEDGATEEDFLSSLNINENQLDQLQSLMEKAESGNTGVSAGEPDEQAIENVLKGEMGAQDLRVLLKEFGMSEDLLGQISDEDLMSTYEDTLSK